MINSRKINFSYWLIFFSIYLCVDTIGTGALTVAISNIHLGRKPSIFSSYKRTFNPTLWKLLVTQWLWFIGLIVSILLIVVPAFYFLAFFSFVVPVVMLEGRWGVNAFKRSKALAKGFYKRIGFVMAIVITGSFLLEEAFDIFASNLLKLLNIKNARLLENCISQIAEIVWPLIIAFIVLMYYDLRTHKESNESITIAEDLRH